MKRRGVGGGLPCSMGLLVEGSWRFGWLDGEGYACCVLPCKAMRWDDEMSRALFEWKITCRVESRKQHREIKRAQSCVRPSRSIGQLFHVPFSTSRRGRELHTSIRVEFKCLLLVWRRGRDNKHAKRSGCVIFVSVTCPAPANRAELLYSLSYSFRRSCTSCPVVIKEREKKGEWVSLTPSNAVQMLLKKCEKKRSSVKQREA